MRMVLLGKPIAKCSESSEVAGKRWRRALGTSQWIVAKSPVICRRQEWNTSAVRSWVQRRYGALGAYSLLTNFWVQSLSILTRTPRWSSRSSSQMRHISLYSLTDIAGWTVCKELQTIDAASFNQASHVPLMKFPPSIFLSNYHYATVPRPFRCPAASVRRHNLLRSAKHTTTSWIWRHDS